MLLHLARHGAASGRPSHRLFAIHLIERFVAWRELAHPGLLRRRRCSQNAMPRSLQQLREVAKGKAHQQAGSHEPATADQAAAGPVSILARLEDWFMCAAKA